MSQIDPTTEFSKTNIAKKISDLTTSIPTATDKEHDASWWNTSFGRLIKQSIADRLEILGDEIEELKEFWQY